MLLYIISVRLESCEDVFFFDDDVVGVAEFDVGGRIILGDDFVAWVDGFDVGTDGLNDGIGWGFFGDAEQEAGFGGFFRLLFFGNDAIL